MRLVIPPLVVEENDSFKNDALDRRTYGEALLNIVVRSNDELVISLDGKWGEGKTTFVKMWQGLLLENNVPNIYIDAFSNDYVDDAFISVVSAIMNYAETHITKDHEEKVTELKDKAKKVGSQLLSLSARIGIKVATLGVIKNTEIEDLMEIKEDMAKSVSDLIGSLVEERINSHSKDIEIIQSFRELLSSLPSKLQKDGNKPLVIIIDELDRCKPTFAVEIIEKIKHLFSVKNVVFILVMNKAQLEESIKSVYGQNIDAHTYLQKFINLETKIPKRTNERYTNDLSKYSKKLSQLHELQTWGDDRNIIECIEPLADHFNLSLRQLEKIYTNLAVFYGSSTKSQLRLVAIIAFLSVMKVIDPWLFDQLLLQKTCFSKVMERLNLSNLNEENGTDRKLYWLMSWIRYALLSEQEFEELPEEDKIKKYGQSLWQYNISREKLIPSFAQQLSMFVST
ncbi:MAG: P-loop NTPase fold protein [Pseudomonadota bacterium]